MSTPLPPPWSPTSEPAATRGSSARRGTVSQAGMVVGAGAVIVGVSLFLTWGTDKLLDRNRSANEIPLQLLWDTTPASFSGFALRWPLFIAIVLMIAAVSRPAMRVAAVIGAVLALATTLLYVNGVRAVLADPLYVGIDATLLDCIGIGVFVSLIGSVTAMVGSILVVRDRT